MVKVAPGVVSSFDGMRTVYYGTDEALIAAGVVEPHQFPSPAGPRKCVINPDGWIAQAGTVAKRPGQMQVIAKVSPKGTRYEVRVVLADYDRQAMTAGTTGKLRSRNGAESHVETRPIRTHAWPFPVSYGRHLPLT
jgi:hypothetical protein